MDWKEKKQELLNQINSLLTEDAFKLSKCKAFLENIKTQKEALQARLDYLHKYDDSEIQTTAWCADYSTDLTVGTEHGSLEIAREWEKGINIQPAYENASVYNSTRDGILQYPAANFPVTAFWNWLTLPGFQKYRPIHRYATLTNIDYEFNLGTVTIEAVQSKAQHLPINMVEFQEIHDVPIVYMNCHALAFENGDKVIVRFTDNHDKKFPWRNPEVIGFKDHPKPCEGLFFQLDCACNQDLIFTPENIEFTVYNSAKTEIPHELVWNEKKEWFEVKIEKENEDENGYYVTYQAWDCDNKIIQYPAKTLQPDDDIFTLSENLIIPEIEPYQDTMPCIWEHFKGNTICESRLWHTGLFYLYHPLPGEYDYGEVMDFRVPCLAMEDIEEGYYAGDWSFQVEFFTVANSYLNIKLTPIEGQIYQGIIDLRHYFETPIQASTCAVRLRDVAAFIPSNYTGLDITLGWDTGAVAWQILYHHNTGGTVHWEPRPLPAPDDDGGITLTFNFGLKNLTYIYIYAHKSDKLPGDAGAFLECKIDWIDLYL